MANKRVEVAIGVLTRRVDGGWQILIARRPDGAVLGGFWEMPGGKIEADETPERCIVREFAEELGVAVATGDALAVIEHHYEHAHVKLHPFLCTLVSGEPRNLEVAEHRWIRPAELDAYKFPSANRPLIDHLMTRLADGAATPGR
ncbi:MAG: 8-oxo-dGTP diphosphatase MutT [Planctomycetota bacterium]|nr:8-oxo-dGTP diphosphatase MutT [Planctomycetota bacterium]